MLRCWVSLIALFAFLLFVWAAQVHPQLYFGIEKALDGAASLHSFGDLHAILQAASCWRQGVNVYVPDACMGGGEYNYALLLLRFLYVLPPDDTDVAAIIIDLLYIGAFFWLPKPCNRTDIAFRAFAVLSGASLYAAERANFDIVIFLLAFAGLISLQWGLIGKICGYALFIFLAILKFYPVALLVLAARERWPVFCAVAGIVCLGGGVFMVSQSGYIATAVHIIPHGNPFGGTFGSVDLFYGFAAFSHPTGGSFDFSMSRAMTLWLHVTQVVSVGLGFLCSGKYDGGLRTLDEPRKNLLAAGAVVIAGCFLMAQNVDYRAIFLIWAIPGLTWLAQQPGPGRLLNLRLLWVIMFVMWEAFFREIGLSLGGSYLSASNFFRVNVGFWLLREVIWWWLVIQLIAILFAVLKSELARLLAEIKLTATTRKA